MRTHRRLNSTYEPQPKHYGMFHGGQGLSGSLVKAVVYTPLCAPRVRQLVERSC